MGMDAQAVEEPPVRRNTEVKKILLGVAGFIVLGIGLGLILKFWAEIAVLFKGTIGIVLAVAGLVMMSVAKD